MSLIKRRPLPIVPLFAFSATIVCACVLYWAIMAAPANIAMRPWVDIWLEVVLCAFVALVVLITALPFPLSTKIYWVTGILGLFLFTTLALVLKNTSYTLGGAGGDQALYTTLITKYAAYSGNVDGDYRGLPAFYPSLIYYVLGRLAAFFTIEPYHMLKYGTLAIILILPFFSVWCWRRNVNAATALLITFGLLVIQEAYKPSEWISLVMFVPWWLYWVDQVTDKLELPKLPLRRAQTWHWISGGLIGGLIFQIYYYWFFIGAIHLLINIAARKWRRISPAGWSLRNASAVLLASACVSSVYWGPYLYSMIATGGWQALQNRWLPQDGISLQLPFLEFSGTGFLMLGGLLFLCLNPSQNRVVTSLLGLLIAAYVWIALGYVGMLTDHPLLTFKTYLLVDHLLIVAALLGLAELWSRQEWFQQRTGLSLHRLAIAVGIVFILFFGQAAVGGLAESDLVRRAVEENYPRRLLDIMDALTQQHYLDKVILLDHRHRDLTAYRPVYSFLAGDAHGSHPAGLFHQRADFLIKLAGTNNPELFATAFMQNRYSSIDYVLLNRTKDDHAWQFAYSDDAFPNGSIMRTLKFTDEQFSDPYFQANSLKDYTLFTPLDVQSSLRSGALDHIATTSPETLALLYALWHSFGIHLKPALNPNGQMQLEEAMTQLDLEKLSLPTLLDLQLASANPLRDKVNTVLRAKVRQHTDISLFDQNGVEKLQLIGYDTGTIQPQGGFHLSLYFMAVSPVTEDYTLIVSMDQTGALAGKGQPRVMSCTTNTPTSSWHSGDIYRDICTFPIEAGAYNVTFDVKQVEGDRRIGPSKGKDKVNLGVITFP